MHHELREYLDEQTVSEAAAHYLAERIRASVATLGSCSVALSGGRTPTLMFFEMGKMDLPWESTRFFQVDERVAGSNDPARNVIAMQKGLGDRARLVAMPVEEQDLLLACEDYAALLPKHFDVIHLGLGPDGHTASLVPGDPVLEVTDRRVALTSTYQGHRRMTLTYQVLNDARELVWVVTGADKHHALSQLLDGDRSIPAGRVAAQHSIVFTDAPAL